ncbi:hypothetical protein PENTCL1PPCAC_19320, partial [Pristionchus entomophagus]
TTRLRYSSRKSHRELMQKFGTVSLPFSQPLTRCDELPIQWVIFVRIPKSVCDRIRHNQQYLWRNELHTSLPIEVSVWCGTFYDNCLCTHSYYRFWKDRRLHRVSDSEDHRLQTSAEHTCFHRLHDAWICWMPICRRPNL